MSLWLEYKTTINTRDVDGTNSCRPSALLGCLQEAATVAGEKHGFGRDRLMERHGAFWMLARVWYRLDRPLKWGEELTIHTWHRGGRGASMYRDFDLFVDGKPVGEAVSVWVLVRMADRKLMRIHQVPELEGTGGGERNKDILLTKVRMDGPMELGERRLMHYSDTDINGHVNNTRYADFACDAIRADRLGADEYVCQLQIGYTAECRPGEVLDIMVGREGDKHLVHGVDQQGKARFDAMVMVGKRPE